ncbi:MAG: flagellar hook capping protein [Deltaproteobacteria bacterium]|nr:MAG: flagellar hook capping protein [Deltaproteobacteria bacterium]RLC11455.1 MAG: flagellar hook capping protein [Deltaproteobacteria bacterium]
MAITAINANTIPSSENTQSTTDVLGKDDFLQLLVAQLQNQDPLKPMESTEFTAQLAQFSSLEQLYNVNDNLNGLGANQLAMNNTQTISMLGKSAWAYGNIIQKSDTSDIDIHFGLSGNAVETVVNIFNAQGDFVKTISAGAMEAGDRFVAWDGTDSEGRLVSDGLYQFEVLAGDAEGGAVSAETFIVGAVTGVTFDDNGVAHLLINDMSIPMNSVVHVAETENIAETGASILTYFTENWR